MMYSEKVKSIRKSTGLSQIKFCNETGIPISTLKKVESGVQQPSLTLLSKIINHNDFFKYSLWLFGDKTAPSLDQVSPLDTEQVDAAPTFKNEEKIHIELPFYEISASAGVGLLAEVEEQPKTISFEPNWLRSEVGVCPTNVFLMLVEGDSMQPTLKNGSMIMVNKNIDNLSDGIYVMRYDNNLLVKRLQMLPGGIIRVKSDNSMYDPWEITKSQLDGEELALIGRVVWTGQKM
ncbi:helix-turn-helix transcriptional regulator [Moritella sp. 5]|uniref:XRE family transcriptional regulator n=1 Tax=Moritella sp. 5 TaxID=2746231 RepID=UPI001BAB0D4C|nr:helix-turn-helix transcriptional regulator [Moritella sp. 5]QUM81695.1 helix-turn-helix transcriptional regulator [Moritella sp. 5]